MAGTVTVYANSKNVTNYVVRKRGKNHKSYHCLKLATCR